jgi:hypothetical protein
MVHRLMMDIAPFVMTFRLPRTELTVAMASIFAMVDAMLLPIPAVPLIAASLPTMVLPIAAAILSACVTEF